MLQQYTKKFASARTLLLPEDVIEFHLSIRHLVRTVGEGSSHGEVLDADGDAVSDSEQLCRLYA